MVRVVGLPFGLNLDLRSADFAKSVSSGSQCLRVYYLGCCSGSYINAGVSAEGESTRITSIGKLGKSLAIRILAYIAISNSARSRLAGVVLAMALLGLLATWIPAYNSDVANGSAHAYG